MLRTTNDTNVWVSAINWRYGKPRQLLELLREHRYAHVTSLDILFEITRVLREYFEFSDDDAYAWYREIGELSEVVRPAQRIDAVNSDPSDNKFVECAIEGRCDYVVSGDRHLLKLGAYDGLKIVTVDAFLNQMSGSNQP